MHHVMRLSELYTVTLARCFNFLRHLLYGALLKGFTHIVKKLLKNKALRILFCGFNWLPLIIINLYN